MLSNSLPKSVRNKTIRIGRGCGIQFLLILKLHFVVIMMICIYKFFRRVNIVDKLSFLGVELNWKEQTMHDKNLKTETPNISPD